MLRRIVEREIVKLLQRCFSSLQNLHLDVDQIAEMHFLAHDIQHVVSNRKMIVSLLVLDTPIRCYLRNLFGGLCILLLFCHLGFELDSKILELL